MNRLGARRPTRRTDAHADERACDLADWHIIVGDGPRSGFGQSGPPGDAVPAEEGQQIGGVEGLGRCEDAARRRIVC